MRASGDGRLLLLPSSSISSVATFVASVFFLCEACTKNIITLKYNYVHPDGYEEAVTKYTKLVLVRVEDAAVAEKYLQGVEVTLNVLNVPAGVYPFLNANVSAVTDVSGTAGMGRIDRGANVEVAAKKAGYTPAMKRALIADDGEDNQTISVAMTEAPPPGAFRVVLEWIDEHDRPSDLDLHDNITESDDGTFIYEISFANKVFSDVRHGIEGILDRDAKERKLTTVETLTIYKTKSDAFHHFYVKHYYRGDYKDYESEAASLANSGAVVTVYTHGGDAFRMAVEDAQGGPVTGKHWFWDLFCIRGQHGDDEDLSNAPGFRLLNKYLPSNHKDDKIPTSCV